MSPIKHWVSSGNINAIMGTCVDWCPTDAIMLNDDGFAERDENACIGCGVCARFCPDDAISLKEGLRRVYVQPPRLRERR